MSWFHRLQYTYQDFFTHGLLFSKAERWPQKLTVQFLPRSFSQAIHPYMSDPVKVFFQFKPAPNGDQSAIKELHEHFMRRSAVATFGCILIPNNLANPVNPLVIVSSVGIRPYTYWSFVLSQFQVMISPVTDQYGETQRGARATGTSRYRVCLQRQSRPISGMDSARPRRLRGRFAAHNAGYS